VDSTVDARATAFGGYADEYDRWRPSYPEEAVKWLLPDGASRVADVGAGTGKLTASLLSVGLSVAAIEPDVRMLDVLRRGHPGAEAHLAGAASLPLGDESVDAVLVADAWHWFPHEAAVRETERVLRSGGWLGLVWVGPSDADGWARDLRQLDPNHRDDDWRTTTEYRKPDVPGLPVEELEEARFDWIWPMSPQHLRGYMATNSACAFMTNADREEHLDKAEAIITAACGVAGQPTVAWRHTAFCVRWTPAAGRA